MAFPILKALVIVAVLAFIVVSAGRALARLRGGLSFSSAGFKCESCRHSRRIHNDGVMCGFEGKTTFKNAVHVNNCTDWESKKKGR